MHEVEAAVEWLKMHESESISRLMEWLRIPSVSTDPAYRDQTRKAAQWAADRLREAGLHVELRETGTIGSVDSTGVPQGSGHPIVWATTHPAATATNLAHVLFYGHYDVQPPDPVDLWNTGPFDPELRPADAQTGEGERIVARGSSDDKGQVMMFLEALRAWKETSRQAAGGARFSVLLEGEEESGSANLEAYIKAHTDELKSCDVCLISDTGMLSRTQPAITYGVRGLVYTEVRLHAANQDLHSGLWGGRAPNPNNELCKVLSQLWDADGKVTIPGFYDAVRPITPDEREAWAKLPFDPIEALKKIGLGPEADRGEAGFTTLEREWGRPTADINGIFGGYTGHGAKTVIPAHASAKVSFRLVADQDPATIRDAFFEWCKLRTPVGCRWELTDHSGGNPATVRTESKYLQAASAAVRDATGIDPVLIKSGGSIPVAGMLKAIADLDTIFMGFGLNDDRVHSPNEKFEVQNFRWGALAHARFIHAMRGEE